jgi:LPXTG-site transpeptidase (sortase) family protein
VLCKAMDKKTKENLLFALEEDWAKFKKPILWVLAVMCIWFGVSTVFNKVDGALNAVEIKGYETRLESAVLAEKLSKEIKISIPSIGVEAPITFVQSTAPRDFLEPLKNGVVHYPSAAPGEQGTAIILGHSAPLDILKKGFNGVFSELKDLREGDEIFVQYDGKIHTYKVEGQEFLQRGQDIPQKSLAAAESKLVLLSCWPPGIDNKRIMVKATAI